MNLETVGLNLAKIRLSKNMASSELSFQLGKNSTYVHKIETAKFNVGIQTLFDICEILEINITDLICEQK